MGILDNCTPAQAEAITHADGPLLVVAGAGSGKTRVITRRVACLVERGVPPHRILAITFTNKAAGEMQERVHQLVQKGGVWVSTFHSMCARMLRQFADAIGRRRNFTIYDAADSLSAVKASMKDLEIDTEHWTPSAVQAAISNAKNELIGPDDYHARAASFFERTAAKVYRRYQERLAQNQALDFDDLLLHAARLLSRETAFRDYWQNRFSHVLIDEYQDTNHAQYVIAKELAARHRNICATGDPDQSIYGWRGADIRNILQFVGEYPDAKVVRLEENFRSTKPIIQAAESVIANNTERLDRALYTSREGGSPLRMFAAPDEEAEAEAIVGQIRKLAAQGRRYADIAIFYRTNFQSRTFEHIFQLLALPYAIVGTVEFYNRREIKDILAYLRVLVNDADDVSMSRIINVPPRGIGEQTVAALSRWAAGQRVPLIEAIRRSPEIPDLAGRAGKAVDKLRSLLDALAQVRGPVAKIIDQAIKRSGYIDWLKASRDESSEERAENLGELVTAAARYDERTPDGTLEAYLEEVALVSQIDEYQDGDNRVTLMTVHAAKGLEFPVVFITGLEEGLFPHQNAMESPSGVEEERRLFYVAITRAKDELFVSYAGARMRFGLITPAMPSRFVEEIPPDVIEHLPLFGQAPPPAGREDERPPVLRKPRREEAPEAEEPAPPEKGIEAGQKVRHPTFGLGEVVELTGAGSRRTALVRFKGIGIKRLLLEYAKLEKV